MANNLWLSNVVNLFALRAVEKPTGTLLGCTELPTVHNSLFAFLRCQAPLKQNVAKRLKTPDDSERAVSEAVAFRHKRTVEPCVSGTTNLASEAVQQQRFSTRLFSSLLDSGSDFQTDSSDICCTVFECYTSSILGSCEMQIKIIQIGAWGFECLYKHPRGRISPLVCSHGKSGNGMAMIPMMVL